MHKHGLRNVVAMGLSFLVVFSSFNPIQGLQITLHGNLGLLALGALFGCLCLFNLISSGICVAIGDKWALFIGAFCAPVYLGAQLALHYIDVNTQAALYKALLFSTSGVLGCGAALVFTAQGGLLSTSSPPAKLSAYGGLFFALYMGNYISGGLILHFLRTKEVTLPRHTFFSLMAPISSLPVKFSATGRHDGHQLHGSRAGALHPPAGLGDPRGQAGPRIRPVGHPAHVYQGAHVAALPPGALQGTSNSFFYGVLAGPATHEGLFGLALVAFGVAQVGASLAAGKLSRVTGQMPLLAVSSLLGLAGLFASYYAQHSASPALYYAAYSMLAVCDAVHSVVLYTVLGVFFAGCPQAAFAYYHLVLAAGAAAMFASSGKLATAAQPLLWSVVLLATLLLLGLACSAVCHVCVEKLEGARVPEAQLVVEEELPYKPLVDVTDVTAQ